MSLIDVEAAPVGAAFFNEKPEMRNDGIVDELTS